MENPIEKLHSRKRYEELEKEGVKTRMEAQENPGIDQVLRLEIVNRKLKSMEELGSVEALELVAEHGRLVQQVVNAERALFNFEKSELDMHREESGDGK